MRKDLQHAIQMCHAWTEAVDEFIEDKLAVDHVFGIVRDFTSHLVEIFGLNFCQSIGSNAAVFREIWVRLLPLIELNVALLLSRAHMIDEFFEYLIVSIHRGENIAKQ